MLVDMAGSENIEAAGQSGFEAKMQVCDASATNSCTYVGFMCSKCTANNGMQDIVVPYFIQYSVICSFRFNTHLD